MRYALIFLFYCLQIAAMAQTTVGFEPFAGYHFAPNRIEKTGESMNRFCYGADLVLDKSEWIPQSLINSHGSPTFGFRLRAAGIRPLDTFGYSFAIMPQLEQPVFKWKKIPCLFRLAYGVYGNTKVYDFESNFDNRAISSYVNFGVDFAGGFSIRSGNNNELRVFTGLYHVSNGSMKMSNGGINLIYLSLGYRFSNQNKLDQFYASRSNSKLHENYRYYLQILPFIANREIGYIQNIQRFWISGVTTAFYKKVNSWYSLGLGADFFLDASPVIKSKDSVIASTVHIGQRAFYALGIHQQYEFGRWFFPLGIHHYLNNTAEPVYIRFGLGYSAKSGFTTGCFFKGTLNSSGKLNSDFMEWSLGYRFNFSGNRNNQVFEKQ